MNKIKNLSGKPEALIPVRMCVSISRKSYLNVSKNGFRLALYTFNSDNYTQLMAHIWIFSIEQKAPQSVTQFEGSKESENWRV